MHGDATGAGWQALLVSLDHARLLRGDCGGDGTWKHLRGLGSEWRQAHDAGTVALSAPAASCADAHVLGPAFLTRFPALRSLVLSTCPAARDLEPLAASLPGSLEVLRMDHTPVRSLDSAAQLTRLRVLHASWTGVQALPARLPASLTELCIAHTGVSSIAALAGCRHLERLDIEGTPVEDLSPLRSAARLAALEASGTRVSDLGTLAGCGALADLGCSDTPVADLAPLGRCASLRKLRCCKTLVRDLSVLPASLEVVDASGSLAEVVPSAACCAGLRELDVSWARLDTLAGMAAGALEVMRCTGTDVKDLAPMAVFARTLTHLDIRCTSVSDIGPLRAFGALATLLCCGTPVHDLTPLSALVSLEVLECGASHVVDVSPLAACSRLTALCFAYTHVPSVAALAGRCPRLARLDARGSLVPAEEVAALVEACEDMAEVCFP